MKLIYLFLLSLLLVCTPATLLAEEVEISAIVPGCGDGILQAGEQCDGSSLAGQTCSSRGFAGGSLTCSSSCTFNASSCAQTSGGGSGGGSSSGENLQPEQNAFSFNIFSNPLHNKIIDAYINFVSFLSRSLNEDSNARAVSDQDNKSESPIPQNIIDQYNPSALVTLSPPRIVSYVSQVRNGDEIFLKGYTEYPKGKVTVFMLEDDEIVISDVLADDNAEFTFSHKVGEKSSSFPAAVFNVFKRSRNISIWTMAIDRAGNRSPVSEKVSVSVDDPFFSLSVDLNFISIFLLTVLSLFLIGYIIFNLNQKKKFV